MTSAFDMINRNKLNRNMQRKSNYFSGDSVGNYSAAYRTKGDATEVDEEEINRVRAKWGTQVAADQKRLIIVSVIVSILMIALLSYMANWDMGSFFQENRFSW